MKKLVIIIFSFLFSAVALAQEKEVYTTFFEEPDKPFPVPRVARNEYYTSYNSVKDFLNELAAKHPELITISSIGRSQRGNTTPLVTLKRNNAIPDDQKIRVTFISCVHGDEPISTDSMLYTIYQLAENPELSHYLDTIILQVIPIVNVDGHKDETRISNDGTDLNRNLTILNVPETVNLKNQINKFDPHVVVDFHEYNPSRKDFLDLNDCYTSSYDAMFLFTGNLNVDAGIRAMILNDFVEPTKLYMQNNQRRVTNYATTLRNNHELILNIGGTASRSSATNYALQNRISILMEIRGVTEKEKAVKRRIETSYLAAISYLKITNDLADKIKETIETANNNAIAGSNEIVLNSKPTMISTSFQFINTCTNELESYNFNARNNVEQIPVDTRPRAEAYVIVTKSKSIFNILRTSGIKFTEVDNPITLDVIAYAKENDDKYNLENMSYELPRGAIVIDARQKMGNVLVDLIEPEDKNSMARNKILKELPGSNKLRVFRITRNQLAQLQNIN